MNKDIKLQRLAVDIGRGFVDVINFPETQELFFEKAATSPNQLSRNLIISADKISADTKNADVWTEGDSA